jgi:PhnB protein
MSSAPAGALDTLSQTTTTANQGRIEVSAVEKTSAENAPASTGAPQVHAVTPHIVCAGAAAAIEFYKKAFGATEMIRLPMDDGKIMHACLSINGSSVMLVDEFPEMGCVAPAPTGGSPVTIHLVVDDADAWVARAAEAGGTVVMPVEEMFWGDRYGVIRDPFGHSWSMGTPVRKLTEAELREAARVGTTEEAAPA